MKKFIVAGGIFLLLCFLYVVIDMYNKAGVWERSDEDEEEEGHADEAFEWWYTQRALPSKVISSDGLAKAFVRTIQKLRSQKKSSVSEPAWESIGPANIGGRVLSLAINPESSNVIWAGSASGGLWRSRTGGKGANAWEYINTGFYLLSVSSIAINPFDANELYIGTGEISGYNLGLVGTAGARTTYGLGIVKSTDRGATWQTTGLTWLFNQNRSVQKITLNPKNPSVLYAATSEGTYRSNDAGEKFFKILDTLMAMDVVINPIDTNIIYVACGQRNTALHSGVFKSINGGSSFTRMTDGLPVEDIGRTSLSISHSNPNIIFASIATPNTHSLKGLYRTTDGGEVWEVQSSINFLGSQGWYDNVCVVHPANPSIVFGAGLSIYKSVDGGTLMIQKSQWTNGYFGAIPGGGEEGPNTYVHADVHSIIFDYTDPYRMFIGTDGGIFESTDGGESFSGRNGGFVTTQYYNGFANAATDSLIALGGLQDNGAIKWEGGKLWNKVQGGDGGWSAIDPKNHSVMYEEHIYLAISKTFDGGKNWIDIFPERRNTANFIAPFVVTPSNGNILYAGTKHIIKSTDGGSTWNRTNDAKELNGTRVSCIGVCYSSAETLIAATGQGIDPMVFEVFSTTNGGSIWIKSASSLPNRYPTDISFDQNNSAVAYLAFSGYGSSHIFKSTDAGISWLDISGDLPDFPVQSVCVDPKNSEGIYLGTDIGVFRTMNGGITWEPWFDGMPYAMITDVSVSLLDHRLRASTFGNGVYQRKLPDDDFMNPVTHKNLDPGDFALHQNFPNPFNPSTTIQFSLPVATHVTITIYNSLGKNVATLVSQHMKAGTHTTKWHASEFASGVYFYRIEAGRFIETRKSMLLR